MAFRVHLAVGVLAVLATAALASADAGPARAIVPPKDCGMLTVKGHRYKVKADQMRCASARDYTRAYLARRRRPAGFRCRDFGAETKLRFRCAKGIKVFFAIRR